MTFRRLAWIGLAGLFNLLDSLRIPLVRRCICGIQRPAVTCAEAEAAVHRVRLCARPVRRMRTARDLLHVRRRSAPAED